MTESLDQILISISQPDFEERFRQLRFAVVNAAGFKIYSQNHQYLQDIIRNVIENGDNAVREYTEKFDGVKLEPAEFRIPAEDMKAAHEQIDPDLLKTLRGAIENVRRYQTEIFNGKNIPGKVKYTPIKRVGVCIPGASAPLPSTVIMTAVPAQVAGVREIAVISPPRYQGTIHPVILALCHELQIPEVYRIGGAQAVAALALGTDTIPKVYKIVGPGNQWVSMAKRELFGMIDVDSIAGPSEVLIVATEEANPAWVAADMLSQAEHDPGSAVVLTDSERFARTVLEELEIQVRKLQRSKRTIECLKKYSGIAVCRDLDHAVNAANLFASEHLQIQCGSESRKIASRIENAGAVFIGEYTPVATGDYWAGPSHTLPTGMSAKYFSPLSSNDFVKSSSIIEFDRRRLADSADDIIRLAMTEGLDAHAKSVEIRVKD